MVMTTPKERETPGTYLNSNKLHHKEHLGQQAALQSHPNLVRQDLPRKYHIHHCPPIYPKHTNHFLNHTLDR